jgi:acyl-CoA synthetase (AMP-forming)/AMP-acid ligase II
LEEVGMWLHPEIRVLPDIVRYWANRTPGKVALRAGSSDLTYGQLAASTQRLGLALAGFGTATPRAGVAFIGKNVPEFWLAWLGVNSAGRPFVPLNWRSTVAELVELVGDADPVVIFADREYAEAMERVTALLDRPVELVVFDSVATGGAGLTEWVDARRPTQDAARATRDAALPTVHGEDIALIAYTSGTTGRPKGVMIRHEAFDLFALSDDLEPTISWSGDDIALMVMPNFHLAGSWVSLPALYHGGTIVMVGAFDPAAVLAAIEKYRPTVTCLVPTAIGALLDAERTADTDFSSLRTLVYAGSPIAPATIERAVGTFGCELRQFYGTSETYIITILRPDDHSSTDPALEDIKASCGAPVPLVQVRVVDDHGGDLPDGEIGQVLVRSPMVMAGYYRKPEETTAVLRDGWYWTGDLGYRAPSGHHFLVDRAKDMIVTGGENVYSVEVERALQRHPAVAAAAVVGTPHPRWGEAVTAFVVPCPGREPDGLVAELTAHCRELIAAYKVPKIIHIEQSLPVTPTGKVRKVDLRQRAAADHAQDTDQPRIPITPRMEPEA